MNLLLSAFLNAVRFLGTGAAACCEEKSNGFLRNSSQTCLFFSFRFLPLLTFRPFLAFRSFVKNELTPSDPAFFVYQLQFVHPSADEYLTAVSIWFSLLGMGKLRLLTPLARHAVISPCAITLLCYTGHCGARWRGALFRAFKGVKYRTACMQ